MWPSLFRPLLSMLGALAAGLAVGLVIEGCGWAPLLAKAARPITRWGKLPDDCGAAFATAFISAAASNTLLMEAHQNGRLTRRQMRLGYLLNTGLPVFLLHLPTTFFIVAPLARSAGVLYLTLNGLAALLRTMLVLILTRCGERQSDALSSARHQAKIIPITSARSKQTAPPRIAWGSFAERFRKRLLRLALFTVPTYLFIHALQQAGAFDALRDVTARWIGTGLLPVEAAGVLVFAAASEFSTGVAAAGALLDAGALTLRDTVLALLIGNVVATPLRALRHQLPAHAGIFTPSLGLKLLLLSQSYRVISLAVVTCFWLLFF